MRPPFFAACLFTLVAAAPLAAQAQPNPEPPPAPENQAVPENQPPPASQPIPDTPPPSQRQAPPVDEAQPALPPIPPWRVLYRNLLVARYNPIGLLDEGAVLLRARIYQAEAAALRDNFIGFGPTFAASPAFVRGGGLLELQPLSILNVWAAFEGVQWFGTSGHLQSFPSATVAYDDDTLEARRALPETSSKAPHAVAGTVASMGATLQVKVGPIAARLVAKTMTYELDLPNEHRYAYDPVFDVAVAGRKGGVQAVDADLLWQSADRGRTLGLRWSDVQSLGRVPCLQGSTSPDCNPADSDPPAMTRRAGPLVAWRVWQRERGSTGTVIGLAQWWLQHRYRAGQVSSQAIPYVAIGLHVTADLVAGED